MLSCIDDFNLFCLWQFKFQRKFLQKFLIFNLLHNGLGKKKKIFLSKFQI